MGLSLVRAALKNCALGGILESKKQELLISEIENQVQHALAPEGALSTSIRVQMTNVLQQSNKTVREIFMGSDEAGYPATADGPRGSTQHAGRRPPPMDGMSPVEARMTEEAFATQDGTFGISAGAVIRGVHNRRHQTERAAAGLPSDNAAMQRELMTRA